MELFLVFLGVLIFAAHVFNALFERTRIPRVLYLLVIGILVGPIFGIWSTSALGSVGSIFTKVTLIVILFEGGTRLSKSSLTQSFGAGFTLSIVNFVTSIGVGFVVGYYIVGLNTIESAFLGSTIGSISSAVVLPMLQQIKLGKKAESTMFLEAALSDVICLLGALAILDAMENGTLSLGDMTIHMTVSFTIAIIVGLVVGFVWMLILRNLLPNMENSMFTSFALSFVLFGLLEMAGINGGIAVLAFGFIVGNLGEMALSFDKYIPKSKYLKDHKTAYLKEDEKNFYSEIAFIFQTYFFVYIGMNIHLSNMMYTLLGLLFISLSFIARVPVIMGLGKKGFSPRDIKMMYVLNPKGMVSGVLASLPLQIAVTEQQIKDGEAIQGIVYASVLFSIVICSFAIFYFDKRKDKIGRLA